MITKTIGTNVLLRMKERELTTEGGIAIPETVASPATEGIISAIGADVEGLQIGEVVGFPSHLGTRYEYQGMEWLVITQDRLLYVRR